MVIRVMPGREEPGKAENALRAVAANGRNWYNNIDLPGTYRVMVVDGATAVTECTFDVT